MRVALVVVLVTFASPAAGDDGLSVRVQREHASSGPMLSLDPVVLSRLEGLTGERKRTATTISIGRTDIVLEGIESANVDRPDRPAADLATRGWRTGIRIARDLGPLRLEATAALGHVENPSLMFTAFGLPASEAYNRQAAFSQGTHYDVGVALTYRRKLSRWMTAWISLSIGRRTWIGDPPAKEPTESSQLMLSVGTTFK